MSALRNGIRCVGDVGARTKSQWTTTAITHASLAIRTAPRRMPTISGATASRSLTTTASRQSDDDLQAAMANRENELDQMHSRSIALPSIRPMPASPSYFARFTSFYDTYVHLQDLMLKYGRLPTVSTDKAPPVSWKTRDQIRISLGERMKGRDLSACMDLVKRLHRIHPDLMPEEVSSSLAPFKRITDQRLLRNKVVNIDRFGRVLGIGRRKTSVARAYVVAGTGEVLINGRPINEAFGRVHDRESALWALKSTKRMDKYNVWARVEGGGTTGQAEALALAIAKGVMGHEPTLKPVLRKSGCLTRDHRAVERKKAGHVKARKSPTWVKR